MPELPIGTTVTVMFKLAERGEGSVFDRLDKVDTDNYRMRQILDGMFHALRVANAVR